MTERFHSMINQQDDYPKLVADNPRALIYMRGPFYDPALSAGLAAMEAQRAAAQTGKRKQRGERRSQGGSSRRRTANKHTARNTAD